MNNIERLRQYLGKASFSSEADRFSALECLGEIEQAREALIENVETAAEEWARYVEADTAPVTLPKYIAAAIAKTPNASGKPTTEAGEACCSGSPGTRVVRTMKHKLLEWHFWRWGGWFRVAGYGLHFKPSKGHEPLFSERYGYTKAFYFGPVRAEILKPVWRKQGGF